MADAYDSVRSLPFPAVAATIGIDLSRFKLTKGEWVGYCAIHQSKSNNTCFRYKEETGAFHCFSCNAKGRGSIDLAKAVNNIGFKAAVELLGSIPPPAPQTPVLGQSGASQGHIRDYSKPLLKDTWRKYAVESDWLDKRVPDKAIREKYGIFAYDNPSRPTSVYRGRIMIPFRHHETGAIHGYMGRATEGEPKYLVPEGFPKGEFLFGAYELKEKAPVKVLYVVESAFSVLHFAALGFPGVALYGWSVSGEQVDTLAETIARGVVYLPDRNKYNERGAVLASLSQRVWVRCPELPDGIDDPEDLPQAAILAL